MLTQAAGGVQAERFVSCTPVGWLPVVDGRPGASGRMLDGGSLADGRRGAASLAPWRVEGTALPAADAITWLIRLGGDGLLWAGEDAPEVAADRAIVGEDLGYWTLVARFALELLAGQRFVPALAKPAQASGGRAVWRPFLDGPADSERVKLLAGAMPPVCRAFLQEDEGAASRPALPEAQSLVDDFLQQTVDALVRDSAGASTPAATVRRPERARRRSPAQATAERWVTALTSGQAQVEGEPAALEALGLAVDQWTAQLRDHGQADAFRTCFRLEPPPSTAVSSEWILRYFLQAADEPSLLVPAAAVWKARDRKLSYLNRRFDDPQERLLADLGRAARFCPAVEASLRQARPEGASLSAEEAYRFLRETAWLLEESGFGVLLPAWWTRGGAKGPRLGVRARLRPAGSEAGGMASGALSLEGLVQFDWELALGDQPISRREFEQLAALKVPLVQVRGQWVELKPEEIRAAARLWEAQAKGSRRGGLGTAGGTMSLGDALRLGLGQEDAVGGLPVAGVVAAGWVDDLLRQLKAGETITPLPAPAGFVGELRPYQARGYAWLAFLRRWGLGACLADDMGLGKTVQTIALLLHDKEAGTGPESLRIDGEGSVPQEPVLLICPTSVVGNWQRELQRFAPSLRVLVHHGSGRRRGSSFARQALGHDVVLSTYALVHRDADALGSLTWAGVILDEAQNVKNPAARQSQIVRTLRCGYRIALTGTPVENHPGDLWAIMDFLNPGFLGTAAGFRQRFTVPIQVNRDPEAMERLRGLVQPFVLRRLKTDKAIITDLPEKQEMKVFCPLTKEQATLYEAVVKDMLRKIEQVEEGIERRGLVLATLSKLKQVCNHPAQFLGDGSALEGRSGKLERLTEMLEEALEEGDHTLVFTQFAEMGELLRRHLQLRFGREVFFLHGGTSRLARERMVQSFQAEEGGAPVFILSLKAGGTGLNLTRANRVFHFDRWWNPAVEDQATDRAYRIGQTQRVQVHKFVCAGTLEERIDAIIEGKKAIAGSLIGSGEAWLANLSTSELRDLLRLGKEAIE